MLAQHATNLTYVQYRDCQERERGGGDRVKPLFGLKNCINVTNYIFIHEAIKSNVHNLIMCVSWKLAHIIMAVCNGIYIKRMPLVTL